MPSLSVVTRVACLGLILVLVACGSPKPVAPGAKEASPSSSPQAALETPAPLPTMRLMVASIGALAPIFVAEESGAFKKYGVPVEMQVMQSNAAVAALIARELEAIAISGPAVVSADIIGGADLAIVGGVLNRFIYSAFGAKDIRSPEDLRGRAFASDRPGTPQAYGAQVALNKLGLKPQDVQLVPVGSSAQALAVLQSGQVAGAVMTPPASFVAETEGHPRLVDLTDVPYQNIGVVALRSRLDELAPAMIPFLRALREGIQRYNSDKVFAVRVLEKYTGETRPEVLDKTYEFFKRQAPFNLSLTVSEEGLQGMLEFLSQIQPEARTAKPSDFYDTRFVDKLGPP